jgi:DNA-binding CsgD family transcriptional regulator
MGEQIESARWAERVETVVASGTESPYLRLWICLLACRKFVHIGSQAKAVQAAEQAAAVVRESAMTEPCMVPWHGAAIEAYIAAGELERATELVAWLEEICRPLPCQAPRAVAAWGGAMVAWRRGQLDAAEEGFQKALAHNAAVPMPLAEAETLIAYGRFLRHTGRPTRARAVLHQALKVLEATGAGRLQAIAREELAGAGGRRARAGPADRLTEKETQVAELAAKGLTNTEIAGALFISPRTVGHHLSSVYRKLGTSSRRQLPARFDA